MVVYDQYSRRGTSLGFRHNEFCVVRIGKGVVRCSGVIRVEAERTPWARALRGDAIENERVR